MVAHSLELRFWPPEKKKCSGVWSLTELIRTFESLAAECSLANHLLCLSVLLMPAAAGNNMF